MFSSSEYIILWCLYMPLTVTLKLYHREVWVFISNVHKWSHPNNKINHALKSNKYIYNFLMIYSSISHASTNEEINCFQFHTTHNKYKHLVWNKMENVKYREVLGHINVFHTKIFLWDWVIHVYYFLNMLVNVYLMLLSSLVWITNSL